MSVLDGERGEVSVSSSSLGGVHQQTVGQLAESQLECDVESPEDPGRCGEGQVGLPCEGRLEDLTGGTRPPCWTLQASSLRFPLCGLDVCQRAWKYRADLLRTVEQVWLPLVVH